MAYTLNEKIRDLTPYEPIKGTFRIRLDANESYLPLPPQVLSGLQNQLAALEFNRYPDPTCTELCQAFADYYHIDAELVTAGNGSDELISILTNSFLMKGDTILTTAPDFSMYGFYASLSEAKCAVLEKGPELTLNADQMIEKAKETGARMILFSNPCNPTSLGLSRDEVRKLVQSVDALVVLDEAYMDFWDQSLLSEAGQYDNLIILRTCSKAMGSAAIRLGFAVANKQLSNAIRAVKSPYNVNSFTQMAGTLLLREKETLRKAANEIIGQRKKLYAELRGVQEEFPGKYQLWDSCTNFVFLRLESKEKAKQLFQYLLDRQVAIRYMGQYLRITAGSDDEIRELIRLWRQWFQSEEEKV